MVRLRYVPDDCDLTKTVDQLLRNVWNFNTHVDKEQCVDCIVFEEWVIDFLKKKWDPDFVDFDEAIRRVKENNETFINFDEIAIFNAKKVYEILKRKWFFLEKNGFHQKYVFLHEPYLFNDKNLGVF